jgi:hypothetical protein
MYKVTNELECINLQCMYCRRVCAYIHVSHSTVLNMFIHMINRAISFLCMHKTISLGNVQLNVKSTRW